MKGPSESGSINNLVLAGLTALTVGCGGASYNSTNSEKALQIDHSDRHLRTLPSEVEARKPLIDFSDLPKAPEDIYLLLFRNNPNDDRSDDDFLADAAEIMAYRSPYYWHSEVAYFNGQSGKWMSMGCRPPQCSADFPIDELRHEYRGYTVDVRHMRIPLDKQVKARKWFMTALQDRPYSLAGPSETNCADAVVGLAEHGGIPDVETVRAFTRDQVANQPGTSELLKRYKLPPVQFFLDRDTVVFPDEFEKVGTAIGTMQF